MPERFSRDGKLKTLIDSQQNRFWNFEKTPFYFLGCLKRYNSWVAMTSSRLDEFYITDFWIVK